MDKKIRMDSELTPHTGEPTLSASERQGNEAQLRRDRIRLEYHITDEEGLRFTEKLKEKILSLPEEPSTEAIVDSMDSAFEGNDDRTLEIKNAYMDSLAGKAAEMIHFYLTPDQQLLAEPFTERLREHVSGEHRFTSFADAYEELSKNQNTLAKMGFDKDALVKMFFIELKDYLQQAK